jgi:hypothetical protein
MPKNFLREGGGMWAKLGLRLLQFVHNAVMPEKRLINIPQQLHWQKITVTKFFLFTKNVFMMVFEELLQLDGVCVYRGVFTQLFRSKFCRSQL